MTGEVRKDAQAGSHPARHVLHVLRVDQVDFETPPRFQDLVNGDPIHTRGLHGYRTNPALFELIRKRMLACRSVIRVRQMISILNAGLYGTDRYEFVVLIGLLQQK